MWVMRCIMARRFKSYQDIVRIASTNGYDGVLQDVVKLLESGGLTTQEGVQVYIECRWKEAIIKHFSLKNRSAADLLIEHMKYDLRKYK